MMQILDSIFGSGQLPLYLSGLGVFSVCAFMAVVFIIMRRRTADLRRTFMQVTSQLQDAEKIGKFGTFIWDFENPHASFWSEQMYKLCGFVVRRSPPSVQQLVAQTHEKTREEVTELWQKALTQPGPFSFTQHVVFPNGQEKFLQMIGTTKLDANNHTQLIKGVAHDVTKEKQVDQAKSEFVSLASHQLKTPITAVKWFAETLLSGASGELAPQHVQYVQKIQEENQRMMDMINELLNVSRLELGTLVFKLEPIVLEDMVKGVVVEQQPTAESKKITVNLSIEPSLPKLMADKGLLRMVFQNLISNAIKDTPDGGSVECEISSGAVRSGTVTVRVSDTGIGIPLNQQDRIFEKLHRATNAQEKTQDGTGLGLYLVKTIVDKAAGSITFTSTEGKGTTFLVTLPIAWPADQKTEGKTHTSTPLQA